MEIRAKVSASVRGGGGAPPPVEAPAATPERGHGNPSEGVSVSSRRGWGPAASAKMIRHFKTAAAFRAWLDAHHATTTELWVGFFKKHSGRGGLTYQEAVDQALCYGWIDGVRKRVDEVSYAQRFTPRQSRSHWSAINSGGPPSCTSVD